MNNKHTPEVNAEMSVIKQQLVAIPMNKRPIITATTAAAATTTTTLLIVETWIKTIENLLSFVLFYVISSETVDSLFFMISQRHKYLKL